MAAEDLQMDVQAHVYGSSLEHLKVIAEHFKVDHEGERKMEIAKKVCESLQAKLEGLEENEVIPYLQELKLKLKIKPSIDGESETKPPKSEIKNSPVDNLLSTSAFRRQFKINGQIGQPEQKEKLSYTSLVRQIQAAISQGYTEMEIVDGIIRAITPGMVLRRYLETYEDLTLDRLKKVLRSHYGVKNTTELYQSLASASQDPKENPQAFLMRALDLRQQILFACYEGGGDNSTLKYDPAHVQSLFLRTVETGLLDESIRSKIRPFLEKQDVEDEKLIQELNRAVSAENERLKKLKSSKTTATSATVATAIPTPPQKQNTAEKAREDKIMATLQAVQSEIATLKEKVEKQSLNSKTNNTPRRIKRACVH